MKKRFILILLVGSMLISASVLAAPYANSTDITGITFDWSTHIEKAPGSDNWPITWAEDGHQYTAWGDGGGFGGTNQNGRVSLGVARIEGNSTTYSGFNINGGLNPEAGTTWPDGGTEGKSYGIISSGTDLYMWVTGGKRQNIFNFVKMYRSADKGRTWTGASWQYTNTDGIIVPTILQFGQGDTGVPSHLDSDYVYHYFIKLQDASTDLNVQKPGILYLARSPKSDMMTKSGYQWYNNSSGWGTFANKEAVFTDTNGGVGWCIGASYNASLQKYFLTTEHNTSTVTSSLGNMGIFESDRPWGPWKTVFYGKFDGPDTTGDEAFRWNFANKWLSADGKAFTLVWTGIRGDDSWNTVAGNFTVPTPVGPNLDIAQAGSAPTIDGTIDSVWSGANTKPIANLISGTVSGASDLSGSFRTLWDVNNLYVLAEVTDDVQQNDSGTQTHNDDSVEVYVDANNDKLTSYGTTDFRYRFTWNGSSVTIGEAAHGATTGVVAARAAVAGGYVMEVKIPWSTLQQANVAVDALLGLDVHVNDDDDGGARDGKLAWFNTADTSWQDPSTFATAKLVAGASGSAPLAPSALTATTISASQINLAWTDNSTDETGFKLERKTGAGGTYAQIATPGANATTYNDTGLAASTTYFYRVRATNADGDSAYSNEANATTQSGGGLISDLVVNDSANAADWSIRANIQNGDLQYGDRTYTFTSVPALVAGSDWIRTANDSKAYTGATLVTFKVNAGADVYVAHNDAITTKPSWLSEWTDTGSDLVNNEATPKTFSLFTKFHASGSTVSLGNNGSTGSGMYTIVVKTQSSDLDITQAGSAPTIDGTIDSVWSGANSKPIANLVSGTVSGSSDLSGSFRTLWDADNLYVLAEITDDAQQNDSGTSTHNDDSVEVYVDANNDKLTSYGTTDFRYRFTWNGSSVTIGEPANGATTGVVAARAAVTGGYVMEVKIPWSTLQQANVAVDTLLGLDVHVNDDDDGGARDGKLAWFNTADTSWQDPSMFATAKLVAGASQ